MVIRASSSKQIETLVAGLSAGDEAQRDAAVARLTVVGARAVHRLVALAESSAIAPARAAAFRALDAIGDARALNPALRATADPDATVAAAAIAVLRAFVRGPRGAAAVDGLTALALDRERPESLRVAALRALRDLEPATIAPLLKSLATDPAALVSAEATADRSRGRRPIDPADLLRNAADNGLPDDAAGIQQAIVRSGGSASDISLGVLLRLVERLRDREAARPADRRAAWAAARAAAHLALAKRGSRIALYDLRESLEAARQPLPVECLAALSLIGDAACLDPIAAAYTRSHDAWWRERLADAFRTIVKRERLTRRHAAVKKVEKKWPAAFRQLTG